MVVYGSDDVSALVLDIGSYTTKAGYAGDDTPKAVFPTSYGYRDEPTGEVDETGKPKTKRKLWLGDFGAPVWKPHQEVGNPFRDGQLEDWTHIPDIIRHAFVDNLRTDPSDHPVLVCESAWNTPANRERMAEILFEEFKVPAFYIANSGVLTAFASGRGTALVIEIGRTLTSVVPVVDGFVLRKGLQQSALGTLARRSAIQLLGPSNHRGGYAIPLVPAQLIGTKTRVEPNHPAQFTVRQDRQEATTATWRDYITTRQRDEWIHAVGGVSEIPWTEHQTKPPKFYEFPSGYSTHFGQERLFVGEPYFNQSQIAHINPNLPPPIPQLIQNSIQACEGDLRAQLIQNVVLSGGGSLLMGLPDRLNRELTNQYQGRFKLNAAANIIERQYGAWVGGSILASLGTFHQLWISRAEWQEHGKAIIGQRCK